ncbi:unnamed protein product, partial [Scytosiphon promiscuus]
WRWSRKKAIGKKAETEEVRRRVRVTVTPAAAAAAAAAAQRRRRRTAQLSLLKRLPPMVMPQKLPPFSHLLLSNPPPMLPRALAGTAQRSPWMTVMMMMMTTMLVVTATTLAMLEVMLAVPREVTGGTRTRGHAWDDVGAIGLERNPRPGRPGPACVRFQALS